MIKLLSISGSPVKGSSTDILLKTTAEAISKEFPESEIRSDFIKINDLKFIDCQACGESPAPEFCFFDGLDEAYQLLAECDCLLFGSPIYFDAVSAQAKSFIDRCNCVRPPDYKNEDPEHDFIKLLTRKRPGAIILVGSEGAHFEGARRTIAGFFKWVEVVNEGQLFFELDDFNRAGRVIESAATMQNATDLGKELANLLRTKYAR